MKTSDDRKRFVRGSDSQDGMFMRTCHPATWSDVTNRWEINVWDRLSGIGLSADEVSGCTVEQADEMTRNIFLRDGRIKEDEPFYEVIGQIRLVRPPKEL